MLSEAASEVTSSEVKQIVRFGAFEFQMPSRKLYKRGIPIRLQEKPTLALMALLREPGGVVSRESLCNELWPDNTFVDYEAGLNTAISKLRTALGDSIVNPIYIERVRRTGYRFVAPVESNAVLETVAETQSPPEPPVPNEVGVAVVAETAKHQRPMVRLLMAALVLIGCAAGVAIWWQKSAPTVNNEAKVVRFAIRLPQEQILPQEGRPIAISKDGSSLGYIAAVAGINQVFVKRTEEDDFHPVPGTQGASLLFFSPDGRSLAFLAHDKLQLTDLNGRSIRLLLQTRKDLQGSGTWSDDGYIYFGNIPSQAPGGRVPSIASLLYRVKPGQTPELLTPAKAEDQTWYFAQQFLPSQRQLLFSVAIGPHNRKVEGLSLSDGSRKILADYAGGGFYLPTGHLVFSRKDSLLAAPFSLREMRTTAPASVVISGLRRSAWVGGPAALSATGTLAWIPAPMGPRQREFVWVDRAGREETLDVPPGAYDLLALSPSNTRLLIAREESGRQVLWDYEMTQRKWRRIASTETSNPTGAWSPDEKLLAFTASFEGEDFENLYIKKVNGEELPQRLAASPSGQFAQSWSTQNGLIYSESDKPKTHIDLFSIFPEGQKTPKPAVMTQADDAHGEVSPDGKWIVYCTRADGEMRVYARSYPGSGTPVLVAAGLATAPLWSPKGNEIFFRRPDEVWAVSFADGKVGTPKKLFSGRFVEASIWNRRYCLSANGQRFLLMREMPEASDNRQINVIVNWASELSRTIPGAKE